MTVNKPIPYGKHLIDSDDIAAVVDVLENHFLTQGHKVPEFEKALADYAQVHYAVAVNSGTSALHIACLAAGVSSGDYVWTTPNTFVASANCALYCGAIIDFVDIAENHNMCMDALEKKLRIAAENNTLPKVIICVHFAGVSCDMKIASELAAQYGVTLIEDASHALGGQYLDRNIGCCQFSAMTICSFHPVKPITTAEGGAVLTHSADLRDKLTLFAKHGVTRDNHLMNTDYIDEPELQGDWYYQQVELGYNYRLSDLQAALGLSQLPKLMSFTHKRRALAQAYQLKLNALVELDLITLPNSAKDHESAWHIYVIELNTASRKQVFDFMRAKKIGVNVHYIPVHLQPYYRQLGFEIGDFPNAEAFYHKALTLPLYPELTDAEQDRVVSILNMALLDKD